MTGRVFLCHSSRDMEQVRELYRRLQQDGLRPWLGEKDIKAGQNWDGAIRRAIRESRCVLVCLSKSSVTGRGYIQKEIKEALDVADEQPEGSIFLIPVRLERCQVPARLRFWHWVDLFEEDGYDRLLNALRPTEDGEEQQGHGADDGSKRPSSDVVDTSGPPDPSSPPPANESNEGSGSDDGRREPTSNGTGPEANTASNPQKGQVIDRLKSGFGKIKNYLVRPCRAHRTVVILGAAAIVLVLVIVTVMVAGRVGNRHSSCPSYRAQLRVTVTPELNDVISTLADDFTKTKLDAAGCRTIEVAVSSASADKIAVALGRGWDTNSIVGDIRDLGPQPDVYIAGSRLEIGRVLAADGAKDTLLTNLGSIALSPLVVAWPRDPTSGEEWKISLNNLVGQAATPPSPGVPPGVPPLRLTRLEPRSPIGLASLDFLYSGLTLQSTGDRPGADSTVMELKDLPGQDLIQRLERDVGSAGEDPAALLCQVRQAVSAVGAPPSAALITEQAVVASNSPAPAGNTGCSDAQGQRLLAQYPAEGAYFMDYPFTLVNDAPWTSAENQDHARALFNFLRTPAAQNQLKIVGFRGWDNTADAVFGSDRGVSPDLGRPDQQIRFSGDLATLARSLTKAWQEAHPPTRTLIALDVSASMSQPGEEPTRRDAALAAIEQGMDGVQLDRVEGNLDQVGLWAFAEGLDGGDYKVLAILGVSPDQVAVAATSFKDTEFNAHLDNSLSTMLRSAFATLAMSDPEGTFLNTIVVFTDGENGLTDSDDGAVDAVLSELQQYPNLSVQVEMLAFGAASCEQPGFTKLRTQSTLSCTNIASPIEAAAAFSSLGGRLWRIG